MLIDNELFMFTGALLHPSWWGHPEFDSFASFSYLSVLFH